MDMDQFEQQLTKELAIILDTPVFADTRLLVDAGLDSFGILQIIAFLEDIHGIRILDEHLAIDNFASVAVIAHWAWPMLPAKTS